MEKRVKNLEKRMDKVERTLKLAPPKKGVDVKCPYCGWVMSVTSKRLTVSCSSCGNKIENTSLGNES